MAESITDRVRGILRLLVEGHSDQQIAQMLHRALSTVKGHNRQIYEKLGAQSRTQAIARAQQLGLLGGVAPTGPVVRSITNLPAQTTELVGRKHEINQVQRLLQTVRLVTLSGPPGTGKTRLALQVATAVVGEFQDGVYFVSLAPRTDPDLVSSAIAALFDITEVVSEPLIETLKHYLFNKQTLLVLDNFEHLLKSSLIVSALLASAPNLKILVTSRRDGWRLGLGTGAKRSGDALCSARAIC